MADTLQIHDDGAIAHLAAQLHQLAEQLRGPVLEDAAREAAPVILAAARPPRLTGRLATSLTADATANGVTFASSARYWTYVHYGAPRHHLAARPFYAEALRANADQLAAVYAEHLTDTITRTIT